MRPTVISPWCSSWKSFWTRVEDLEVCTTLAVSLEQKVSASRWDTHEMPWHSLKKENQNGVTKGQFDEKISPYKFRFLIHPRHSKLDWVRPNKVKTFWLTFPTSDHLNTCSFYYFMDKRLNFKWRSLRKFEVTLIRTILWQSVTITVRPQQPLG